MNQGKWRQEQKPPKERNRDTPLGYSRRTALRRQQCDVRLESWNLRIRWAGLREARSLGNTKYTVSLGFDGAFGYISMVTTFQTDCYHGYEKQNCSIRCSLLSRRRTVVRGLLDWCRHRFPCGGGVKYLHRSPASRRKRHKGKSRIWDSKIWSRVPRDSDTRMNALARASSKCKWQTHPLIREDVL
jgi:hypothetical protein